MSLKNQIQKVEGIHGLDAYAASHTVEIYYDKNKLSELDVKKVIFSPIKQKVRNIKDKSIDSLSIYEVGINNLFDKVDDTNLVFALREKDGVYGFETYFGEPVKAIIYYNESLINPSGIDSLINTKVIEIKKKNGVQQLELNFEIDGKGKVTGKMGRYEYEKNMFPEFDRQFNKYETKDEAKLSVLIYPMPEAGHPLLKMRLSYLTSHLSKDPGIVRMRTYYEDEPMAMIYFDSELTNLEKVKEAIKNPVLRVSFSNGTEKDVNNPYKSKPDGKVILAGELPEDKK
jgi:copper chaperone CopZ